MSVSTYLFLRLFLPLSLLLISGAGFYGNLEIERELTQLRSQEVSSVRLGAGALYGKSESITRDLMLLSTHSALSSAVNQHTPENIAHLAEDFANFSGSKRMYDQIRWLDETGMEVVRVDYVQGNPVVVPADKLQNKGKRYYFTDAFKLNPGEVFISPLDLNIDQKRIERPYKPMLRIATPVTDQRGRKRGIVILNYYGNKMLRAFSKATADIADHSMVINTEGYWLKSPNPVDEWGFMFKRPELSMAVRTPAAWKHVSSANTGQLILDDGLWTWETVYPILAGQKTSAGIAEAQGPSLGVMTSQQYFWKSVSHYPADMLNTIYQAIWFKIAGIAGLLLGLIGLGCWKLAHAWALLATAKEKYKNLANFTYDWETWIDPTGHYVYCSPSCARITGRTVEAFIADPNLLVEITHPDDRAHLESHLQLNNASDGSCEFTFRIVRPDGQLRWLEHACQPVFGETGSFLGRRASNRDITERKLAEERERLHMLELAHVSRLSTMGEMAAEIAHELNQPLTSIASYGDTLTRLLRSGNWKMNDVLDALQNITHQALRAGKIIRHLRGLVSNKQSHKGRYDANRLIDGVLQLITIDARRYDVEVVTELSNTILRIWGDKILLEQVVMNLVRNAIEAMSSETKSIDKVSERRLTIRTRLIDSRQVEIEISDTGPGIASEQIEKIFEPFYTTKPQGMGMGLSICRSIVEDNGGRLWVQSKPGVGASFRLTIPVSYQGDSSIVS